MRTFFVIALVVLSAGGCVVAYPDYPYGYAYEPGPAAYVYTYPAPVYGHRRGYYAADRWRHGWYYSPWHGRYVWRQTP